MTRAASGPSRYPCILRHIFPAEATFSASRKQRLQSSPRRIVYLIYKQSFFCIFFRRGIDAKAFSDKLTAAVLYGSDVADAGDAMTISIPKDGDGQ